MAQENVKVVRVQQRIFRGLPQEVIRMGHDILINGCRGSYIKNNAGILSAACTSGLLPRTGNSAGIAAHDAGIQRTNVNAQLQRIGGYHRINLPCTETTLNLPSFCRQVAAPIAPHPTGIPQGIPYQIFQVPGQHFHGQPALGKGDGLNAALQQHAGNVPRYGDHTFADT